MTANLPPLPVEPAEVGRALVHFHCDIWWRV